MLKSSRAKVAQKMYGFSVRVAALPKKDVAV